jgi:hypothetical protein
MEVDGVLPEAADFDASWGNSTDDNTVARAAYVSDLAKEQLSPNNLLNSEYGDKTTANDDQTCVAFNLVTNRNSLVRESGEGGGARYPRFSHFGFELRIWEVTHRFNSHS